MDVMLPVTDKTIESIVTPDEYIWTRHGVAFFISTKTITMSLYFQDANNYDSELVHFLLEKYTDPSDDDEEVCFTFCEDATIFRYKDTDEVGAWLDNGVPVTFYVNDEEKE